MNDEDYMALIEELQEELRAIGASDIADDRHYMQLQDGVAVGVAPPQMRLTQMLQAFERFLATRDRATYTQALRNIGKALHGDAPAAADVESLANARALSLAEAPIFTDPRADLRTLITHLTEPPPDTP